VNDKRTYLGDGLYGDYDGLGFTLSADREDTRHWVYLEPQVIDAFLALIERSYGIKITTSKATGGKS